ncbi:hypothetical protein FB45DRAFT_1058090 [Roridomyces roridus]|uniref:Uncharacterized protein n=1 Tax=Roridomyces roridus TaxID=1738132 RepID=A0AAD7FMU6_9AGAR|nr:hypothetical protein FB45DRAFT_1058090 [Roridomyces roridus]
MVGTFFNLLALAAATKLVAAAPAPELVTVTVPPQFFDPAVTFQAAVVGVDSNGHTTYALNQPAVQDGKTVAFATGTLVAGGDPAAADYALSFTSQGATAIAGFDCGPQSGSAVTAACTLVANGDATTATVSLTQFVLDVTGTGAAASATQTNGGSSQPAGASKPSSARTLSASTFMLISPLLAYYLL